MIIGYFDLAVLGILILANVIFWKKRLSYRTGCFGGILIFGLILPLISQRIEINSVLVVGEKYDDTKLLYTYFKFVLYWLVGACQIAIVSRKYKNDQDKS